MRLLSLWQPWAAFMAWRFKIVETRSWITPFRGLVAIHASKTREAMDSADELLVKAGLARPTGSAGVYHFGAVVAVGELADAFVVSGQSSLVVSSFEASITVGGRKTTIVAPTRDEVTLYGGDGIGRSISRADTILGNLARGRGALVFKDLCPLSEPLPLRGEQGLREVKPEIAQEIWRRRVPA